MNLDVINRKKISIVIIVFICICLVSTGTYAFWEWSSTSNTAVVFTTEAGFSCSADGGSNIDSSNITIMPSSCTSAENALVREITVNASITDEEVSSVFMNLWLDIDEIGDGLSESENFKYALTTSNSSCTKDVVSSGNFNDLVVGDSVSILNNKRFSSTGTATYYLYIWLDEEETSLNTVDQSFILSLNGNCVDSSSEPEAPILDEGMIPVTIADDGIATTISSDDSSWYDYGTQKWANIVLVNEESRETYLDTTGVTVNDSDILAYYVWIPRYKYKIWTTGVSAAGNEQSIEILFEGKDAKLASGTTVGSYKTPTAFWWDEDSDSVVDDGETLAGIWVGKFETSANTDSTCYTSNSIANCVPTNVSPRIVPNVKSLRYQTVSNQFITAQKFSSVGNSYGLTNSIIDAHMMKDSEWGAVAYLLHSEYGINSEIYINNSSEYFTGRSGGNVGGSVVTVATQYSGETSTNQYNSAGYYTWTGQTIAADGTVGDYAEDRTLGTKASSTGNVTGVYDLSGGAWEYVMGNYNDTTGSSGFSTFPASKYYDKYTTTSSTTACSNGVCFGHALSETSGWYGDYAYFVSSSSPWFLRGGSCLNGANAGVFASVLNNGSSGSSWRSVLVNVGVDYFTVQYDANGGTDAPSYQVKNRDEIMTLSSVVPIRDGYTFLGWDTSSKASTVVYSPGDEYTMDASVILYAVWEKISLAGHITNLYYSSETISSINVEDKYYDYSSEELDLLKDDVGNLRYYGREHSDNDFNNYIYFNCSTYPSTGCETWRIVMVRDEYVKLVRTTSIGSYVWDNDGMFTTDSDGWTGTTVNVALNDYYNDLVDHNSVNETLITSYTWKYGNNGISDGSSSYDIYNSENLGNSYDGKIALLSPSDIAYSNMSICNTNLGYRCTSWLTSSLGSSYLLGVYKGSDDEMRVSNFSVQDDSYVYLGSYSTAWTEYNTYPAVYLSPDTKYIAGDGSSSNPYQININ